MKEEKKLICVNCPKGCNITVTLEDGKVTDLKGYSCEKGKKYAAQEVIRPMRVLTSTVKIENGTSRVLPVITNDAIPLDLCKKAMEAIRKIDVQAPVHVDDVLVKNFLNTGVDLVAGRSMRAKN
jgi:CxxC motif-containing protein